MAIFLSSLLVGFQSLKWLVIAFAWFTKTNLKQLEMSQKLIDILNNFCMLDVFTVGFALFYLGFDSVVEIKTMFGFIALWIASVLNIALDFVARLAINQYIAF